MTNEIYCEYTKTFPVDKWGRIGGMLSLADVPVVSYKDLTREGIASFKVFTTSIRPPSPQMQNNHTDFGRLSTIMDRVSESGSILLVHSEDDEMVQ